MFRRWIVLLILVYLLGACVSDGNTAVSLPTSRPTAVGVITATPSPTSQPTHTPTSQPTNTPTSQPTTTPTPTSPPTNTPSPTPTPCAPGELIPGTFPSGRAEGGQSRYLLYQPPCYGQDGRQYPTLYLFAGNTQDETAWVNYGLIEAADELMLAGEIPPFQIVLADGGWLANNSSGGPWSYEGLVLEELIPHIEATSCAWPEPAGRAIGGISRGGYWSLMIAFRHPEQFVSVGGHSAALLDTHAGPDMNPQFTGLNNDLGDLRIYLDSGVDDYVATNARRLHADMAAQGIPHTYVENPGAHEDSYWPQYVDDYLRWYAEPWPANRNAYAPCRS